MESTGTLLLLSTAFLPGRFSSFRSWERLITNPMLGWRDITFSTPFHITALADLKSQVPAAGAWFRLAPAEGTSGHLLWISRICPLIRGGIGLSGKTASGILCASLVRYRHQFRDNPFNPDPQRIAARPKAPPWTALGAIYGARLLTVQQRREIKNKKGELALRIGHPWARPRQNQPNCRLPAGSGII